MAINVLIFEDNSNLRFSIETMLQWNADFNLIKAMPDANSLDEILQTYKADVILMDIDMPGLNGIEALKKIRQQNQEIFVIMLTVFEDENNIFDAICAGANGYLLKKNFDQVPAAIHDVMAGGAPMTSSVAKKVLSFIPKKQNKHQQTTELLTHRETEILEYVVKGLSYKMIAGELQISVETIRSHIKKIYKKLQVNSATEAIYKYNQG
ncbi:response regulator transcription factor [Pedobacter sp. Leaf132]|uniref:response regulator n=1 Tax=Pedobacter sp. Leaf132 TaxID=2876557 RepID=UPI001E4C39DD|nr:response regulator transcription factor [Pedobacter sp. Leaf132]